MNDELRLREVTAFYDTSKILHSVSLLAKQGEVSCLLGLNGMGKTTTLRSIMGLVDRVEGQITINGSAVCGPTYRRARSGITLVPEDRKVFGSLTVDENLSVATRESKGDDGFERSSVLKLFPRLAERLSQRAGTMSGGEQQMLVVARAILSNPRFMLLDEPTEGLSPEYVEVIKNAIQESTRRGIGVILVEQSLPLALSVGHAFYVIHTGEITYSAIREELQGKESQLEKMLTVE